MARDGLSKEDALNRMHAQMPLEAKLRQATVAIDNTGDLASTRAQVAAMVKRLAPSRWAVLFWRIVLFVPAALLFAALNAWSWIAG